MSLDNYLNLATMQEQTHKRPAHRYRRTDIRRERAGGNGFLRPGLYHHAALETSALAGNPGAGPDILWSVSSIFC